MKIGSLIECIDNSAFVEVVKLNTPYTVKEILPANTEVAWIPNNFGMIAVTCLEVSIFLEEVTTAYPYLGIKLNAPFPIRFFRELLPAIADEVEAILSRELVTV